MENNIETSTAAEAGWHLSRYNLSAKDPEDDQTIVLNLLKGSCTKLSLTDMLALSSLKSLKEDNPALKRLAKLGIIVNFDEYAVVESLARGACAYPMGVSITICPTMGCNFDCPYCFENHRAGKMSEAVQDEVLGLAERMLDASGAKRLSITWFGGEPLLAPDVIETLSERLMALAERKGAAYYAEIITNGYLLDQKNADLLERVKVIWIQITLDGIGAAHDATRRLAGGGPTFSRITDNLRNVKISGRVTIRHNVHEENYKEVEKLRSFVEELSRESGNDLHYYPAVCFVSDAASERENQVGVLYGAEKSDIGLLRDTGRFGPGKGHYCGFNSLWLVTVDEQGNLMKCWEDADKPERSFGSAAVWDPKNPIFSADRPDNLTAYLNTAGALDDAECRDCVWLPACRGGCPNKRLFEKKTCVPYKNDPEAYVLAVYREKCNHNK